MRVLNVPNRINELMSLFVLQVKGASAMTRTDINRVAENVLIPLFKEVYGLSNLRNLNVEGANYPGIDLADDEARVAFQVTSDPDSEKVKHTLEKFVQYRLYERYDQLIIYILTEKQKTYSGRGFEEIIDNTFQFNKQRDIRDFTDLLRDISNLQVWTTRRVQDLLEANFGDGATPLFGDTQEPQLESVYLNLLETFLPETLYTANISIEVDADTSWDPFEDHPRRKYHSSARERVAAALKKQGLGFGTDWVCYGRQIITFQNLGDYTLPLARVIDPITVKPSTPPEFFEKSVDHENVFKSLLWRCLQQTLFHRGVQWQNEDKLFIFKGHNNEPTRKEQWRGKKISQRTVYERVSKKGNPDETYHHKHLGFRTQFIRFGTDWYIVIQPDWFFSYDGYKRWHYGAGRIEFLKKKERNQHVFNHVRFIVHFLRDSSNTTPQSDQPSLSFGDLVRFDSAPALDDKCWASGETREDREAFQDPEGAVSIKASE